MGALQIAIMATELDPHLNDQIPTPSDSPNDGTGHQPARRTEIKAQVNVPEPRLFPLGRHSPKQS